MNQTPPYRRELPVPDDEDQTVVLLSPLDLNDPFGPAEEQMKAVVVEADAAFSPHPALLARRRLAGAVSADASQSMPAVRMLKRRPVLTAIVSAAMCLCLLGLLFLLFLSPSSSNHPLAGTSVRSPANILSIAPSTPGLTPAPSPATSPAAPALMHVPPPPGGNCRLGPITITQESKSLIANFTIINTSSTVIKSWTIVFSFAGKPTWVIYVTNGVFEQMGHQFTISSPPHDPDDDTIAPGSSVYTSFQATWKGANPMPASFRPARVTCSNRSA